MIPLCHHCGAEVMWFRRANGRRHPPVVPIGNVIVLVKSDEGAYLAQERGFVLHQCDSDAVDVMHAARGAGTLPEDPTATLVEQVESVAHLVDCPKCLVSAGERCLNVGVLTGTARPGIDQTHPKWPHAERSLIAQRVLAEQTEQRG